MLSFAFASDLATSAGASTALFGLFGVVIALAIKLRRYTPIAMVGKQLFILAALNLFLDLFISHIDIFGHIGGLLTGFLLGIVISGGVNKSIYSNKIRVLALVGLIIYVVFTLRTGMVLTN